ncbi:hypothetical protein LOTGIDRAFT_235472 [Lottia gigantea]|uniref:AB hydrolase-1 domain-containing protein n=1 Tax=Lottia gigantea TaxID=225164 RepID=V4BDE3_LOTGI|nr:hypothetical protein LOTGIDRAFT_235472 [Lottia gigantea]ESO86449.1 hypothetical protein LOTGIDRAFT_235472 [Lottia gigantea]
MEAFRKCLLGPRLFRMHRYENSPGREYQANVVESGSDKCLKVFNFCWSLSYWMSPILLPYLYRKGLFTLEGLGSGFRIGLSLSIVYFIAYFIRGIGRFTNSDYLAFISVLSTAQKSFNQQNRKLLHRYDSELWAWPVEFKTSDFSDPKKRNVIVKKKTSPLSLDNIYLHILSYMAIHTFGRRMVYPGTTALMYTLVGETLIQARAKLIEEKNGIRAKLRTEDNNELDTMFLDRRMSGGNGSTLVICFEGNAGFYEIGCTGTPIELGYSVLGWNHPGYAESTGVPFPDQEQNAVDTVMQYAIQKLDFTPDNICLFAWSIGGYSASWAAMTYPDVKQVILDATFDDIIPLATSKMPKFGEKLVEFTLKKYMHLNVADQLNKYPGPILIIRRSKDEIITTETIPGIPPNITTNRGNYLLIRLLQNRYPKLITESTLELLHEWLAGESSHQDIMFVDHLVDSRYCKAALQSYIEEHSASFPLNIGEDMDSVEKNQMVLYLASKYMRDFDSTHCTPLPTSFFQKPWTYTD